MQVWPRSILVDAGPLVALGKTRGADHQRSMRFAASYTGTLITTLAVIAEQTGITDIVTLDETDFSFIAPRPANTSTICFDEFSGRYGFGIYEWYSTENGSGSGFPEFMSLDSLVGADCGASINSIRA